MCTKVSVDKEEAGMEGRKTRRVVLATATLAMAALVAGSPAPAIGGAATVKATGNETWSPKTKSVARGTKVVWKNPTGDGHNVVSYKGNWSKSASLPEGGKTSYKFKNSGTYSYRCTIHSDLEGGKCDGMCGKVKVS
jgi:plastocyanin